MKQGSEATTVTSADEIPGGLLAMGGESPEEAEQGLFEALGSDEEFEETQDESKPTSKKAKKADESGAEEEAEESEDDDTVEVEDVEETETESEGESADGDDADQDEADLFEVTLPGGEKKKVTRDELVAGYSRTEDYTRKRQRDADEHRTAMAEVREIRSQYADRLGKLKETLESMGPKKPDSELRKSNPGEYAAQMADYQAFQDGLTRVGGARTAISEEEQKEQVEAFQAHVEQEWTKVVAAVPEWQKPEVATKALAELKTFAMSEYGFTEGEIDSLADARLLLMLRENHSSRQKRQQAKAKVDEHRAEASKRLEPGTRNPKPTAGKRKAAAQKAADERALQTGNVHDAARAIEMLLGDDD
jgi:hypothetical protein